MSAREIPADLLAIQDETLMGAGYGGFEYWGERLMWGARWVGDAPGDNPQDTTWEQIRHAREIVEAAGYETRDPWRDHDTASFEVMPKVMP